MKGKERPSDVFTGPRTRGPLSIFLQTERTNFHDKHDREQVFREVARTARKHYRILSGDFDQSGIFIKVIVDPDTNLESFEGLRRDLKRMGFFPKLIDTGTETIIAIFPLPRPKRTSMNTNIILLALTAFTTIWAGASLWEERTGEMASLGDVMRVLINPMDLLMGGLTFAFPLLLILGTHELGHYFTARRYHVDASLPYFIPVPPLVSPFGTFGALISMKEPISNRRALVDIGAAGPIAGFVVAIPLTILGLVLTGMYPASHEVVEGVSYLKINPPLLFRAMMGPLGVTSGDELFPTAIAGWIGLFVTSINLFPAGQLDGGHIARGVMGEKGKVLSFITVALLLVLGFMTPFKTYLLFAFLILLMGARHPPPLDDVSGLSKKQYAVAAAALLIMILTFHPLPIEIEIASKGGVNVVEAPEMLNVSSEDPTIFQVTVENPGRLSKEVEMIIVINETLVVYDPLHPEPEWNDSTFGPLSKIANTLWVHEGWYILSKEPSRIRIEGGEGERFEWNLAVGCSRYKEPGSEAVLRLGFSTENQIAWTEILLEVSDTLSP
ncbi:hypothetical protein B6U90_04415 [Thermoplasmatales archaeon ex4484_6]|nr:MAG: hypothetical protein B6U90_04415 [Thermoplasmatales archaeon ex4484_6]RLF69273.1 MAG: hypothetical protein DRN57_01330 [Thermoplasmata archaeon]